MRLLDGPNTKKVYCLNRSSELGMPVCYGPSAPRLFVTADFVADVAGSALISRACGGISVSFSVGCICNSIKHDVHVYDNALGCKR